MKNDYDFWMKWNDRLKHAYEAAKHARGINQSALAKACGTSSASVSDWLSGETKNIEAQYLIPACKFLQVSPFWVMLGEESETSIDMLPASLELPAMDAIRLISLYSQCTPEGRAAILDMAEVAPKLKLGI